MEKEKFKLLFYLKRGTQDKNGKSPIMGRISIGRLMVQFSCKCACTPKLWDSRKQRLVGKSAEAVSVNKELDRLQVCIHQVYESLSVADNGILVHVGMVGYANIRPEELRGEPAIDLGRYPAFTEIEVKVCKWNGCRCGCTQSGKALLCLFVFGMVQ